MNVFLQGWYIVTYALAIYHLNLFIAFLTPKTDPSVYDVDSEGKLYFAEKINILCFLYKIIILVCIDGFYSAYNCYGLVRKVSRFIAVSASA